MKKFSKKYFSSIHPKTDYTAQNKFLGLFRKQYISPTAYNLSYELSDYLIKNKKYLESEFTFLADKKTESIYLNFSLAHYNLLKYRFVFEQTKETKTESEALEFYLKSDHFLKFAQELNPHLEATDYEDHFIEKYNS